MSATFRLVVPVLAALCLPAGCANPGSGPAAGKVRASDVFRHSDPPAKKTAATDPGGSTAQTAGKAAADKSDRPGDANTHTLRLQTFAGRDHKDRAERLLAELVRRNLHEGFIVPQGEESVVCYGRYPDAKTQTNFENGRERRVRLLPRKMLEDRKALTDAFQSPGGGSALRPVFMPIPVAGDVNLFRIENAKGEWTLHFMSVYGETAPDPQTGLDSRGKALAAAREYQQQFRVPVFVVKDGEQYLLCAGDLPKDALKLEIINDPGAAKDKDEYKLTERGLNALRASRMPEEVWSKLDAVLVERPFKNEDDFRSALARVLDEAEMRRWGNLVSAVAKPRRFGARGYEREYQAEPVSDEAKRLWDEEELRYFRENGAQLYLPKSFSAGLLDQDGNPVKLRVLSRWLRIPALRGYGVDGNLTPEQRALLGLP